MDDEDEDEEVGRSRSGVQDQEDDVFVEACTTKTMKAMKTMTSMKATKTMKTIRTTYKIANDNGGGRTHAPCETGA